MLACIGCGGIVETYLFAAIVTKVAAVAVAWWNRK